MAHRKVPGYLTATHWGRAQTPSRSPSTVKWLYENGRLPSDAVMRGDNNALLIREGTPYPELQGRGGKRPGSGRKAQTKGEK